jgi:hypothetical protein
MKILHINTANKQGGAESVAHALFASNKDNKLLVKTITDGEELELKYLTNLFLIFSLIS